jgi:hypothetical protein
MAWINDLLARATDRELREAVQATFDSRIGARVVRAISDEHERRTGSSIIWTSHGHYLGSGEPTEAELLARPDLIARCGGPGMCAQCRLEAKHYF